MASKLEFGEKTCLIEEVRKFLKDGGLLHPTTGVGSLDVEVVEDFEKACQLAFESYFGRDGHTWTDIKDTELSQVYATGYERGIFPRYSGAIRDLYSTFTRLIRKKLSVPYLDLLDVIVGDFVDICKHLLVYDNQDAFYGCVYRSYQAGCWPCGWNGDYPAGKMVVFCPPSVPLAPIGGGHSGKSLADRLDSFLQRICRDLHLEYLGTHVLKPSTYENESCPLVVCHTASGPLQIFLTARGTFIVSEDGQLLNQLLNVTKSDFFGD